MFDKKYKIVLKIQGRENQYEILQWLETNSVGLVDIKSSNEHQMLTTRYDTMYYAFENEDDATFFKIKYPARIKS